MAATTLQDLVDVRVERQMRVEVLGPVRVVVESAEVAVTAVRERVLLALLVLHANERVPVDRLAAAMWGDRLPRDVRNQVQVCVSRLRKRLAGVGYVAEAIVHDPAGYRLQIDPRSVDLLEFRRLVSEARAAASEHREEARDRYRAALGLWRGLALAGIDSDLVRQVAAALEEERVRALEECFEVELSLGAAGELVAELTDLTREHPFRESLHGALMRALYGAGRQADALAAYRRLREMLREELGTEPGPGLQRLHRSILSRDPGLDPPHRGPPARVAGAALPPRELPAEASCFVGRARETARVREVLTGAGPARHRPTVMVLYGPGGVGKSALAVHVAHELATTFPDGQLYADLFGSTPGMRSPPACEVLGRLLCSLGVHPGEVPSGEVEAAAMFRSITAERRLLLVLDNAADRDQVAPLVPSSPACAVLVTSRPPLPTLDADGWLRVGPLPDPDALALLGGLTSGREMTPEAAWSIVASSGGLPLGVRIAAGRLASRPDLPVGEYAARLSDGARRLDELELDDLAVRACIRTGYDALLADQDGTGRLAATAFRVLGLLHVPDVAPGVVAAMLGEKDVDTARVALDRLVDAQLLEPARPGRYRLHDLVRLVAAERAEEEMTQAVRDQTLYHAIAFYTGTLWQASAVLHDHRMRPFGHPHVAEVVPVPSFATSAQARIWIDDEVQNLASALEQALASAGDAGRLVPWLSDALWGSLNARCSWAKAHRLSRLVLGVAERRGDVELIANGLLLHGRSEACVGNHSVAVTYLERSLAAWRDLGNAAGSALALIGLGIVNGTSRRWEVSLSHYADALDQVRGSDIEGYAAPLILANMSVSYALAGRLDQAALVAERSRATCPAGATAVRALAMANLASVHCLRGNQQEAARCVNDALGWHRELGERIRVCEALVIRSEVYRRDGRLADAAADAAEAMSMTEGWGYRFLAAAALNQRARIFAETEGETAAAHARALASEANARLTDTFRDPMIDLLLDEAQPSEQGRPGTVTADRVQC